MIRIVIALLLLVGLGCQDTISEKENNGFFNNFNNVNNTNNSNNQNNQNNENNQNNINNCGSCTLPICGDPQPCECDGCEIGEVYNGLICTIDECLAPVSNEHSLIVTSEGESSVWHFGMSIRTEDGDLVERSCPTPGVAPPAATEIRPNESVEFFWDGMGSINGDCTDIQPMPNGRYEVILCYGETTSFDLTELDRTDCIVAPFELMRGHSLDFREINFTATPLQPPNALRFHNDIQLDVFVQDMDDCSTFPAWYTLFDPDGNPINTLSIFDCLCPCSQIDENGQCFVACPDIACAAPQASRFPAGDIRSADLAGIRAAMYDYDGNQNVCYQPQYLTSDFQIEVCFGWSMIGNDPNGFNSYIDDVVCHRKPVRLSERTVDFFLSEFVTVDGGN